MDCSRTLPLDKPELRIIRETKHVLIHTTNATTCALHMDIGYTTASDMVQ